MSFGLCNAPAIFSDYVENIIEVFIDDFSVYGDSFDACLSNLSLVLKRCMNSNLVLNWEKCHFMVEQGIVLRYIVSAKGIEVDKSKIDLVHSLPLPTSVKEVRSFLGHEDFIEDLSRTFQRLLDHYADCSKKKCHSTWTRIARMHSTTLRIFSLLLPSSKHLI